MAFDDEDWIKRRRWDVRDPIDHTLITSLEALCYGYPTVSLIKNWQSLAAWDAAPPELKAEADAYLKEKQA
jgi:hypothetical protein